MLPGAARRLQLDLGPDLAKGEVLLSHLGHEGVCSAHGRRRAGRKRCVQVTARVRV